MTERAFPLRPHEVKAALGGRLSLLAREVREPGQSRLADHDERLHPITCMNDGKVWTYSGEEALASTSFVPGVILWFQETWAHYHTVNHFVHSGERAFSEVSDGLAGYRADGFDTVEDFRDHVRLMSGLDLEEIVINGDRWRPASHMPRWACRLPWMKVIKVEAKRLCDFDEIEADALDDEAVAVVPPEWHWLYTVERV